jgi:hypothetical protein
MRSRDEAKFATLERLLTTIIDDLNNAKHQTHWTEWITVARDYIIARDAAGARYFLSAHGGMGSFNDWAPLSKAGHEADTVAVRVAGELLRRHDVFDSGVQLGKIRQAECSNLEE